MVKIELKNLFSPGKIGNIQIKNRIVRSATYERRALKHGIVSEQLIELYRELAQGGTGLIITGAIGIDPKATGGPDQPYLFDDSSMSEIISAIGSAFVCKTNVSPFNFVPICINKLNLSLDNNSYLGSSSIYIGMIDVPSNLNSLFSESLFNIFLAIIKGPQSISFGGSFMWRIKTINIIRKIECFLAFL